MAYMHFRFNWFCHKMCKMCWKQHKNHIEYWISWTNAAQHCIETMFWTLLWWQKTHKKIKKRITKTLYVIVSSFFCIFYTYTYFVWWLCSNETFACGYMHLHEFIHSYVCMCLCAHTLTHSSASVGKFV